MATRKITFTLPEELVARFTERVAPRELSRYLAAAIEAKLAEEDKRLIRACAVVNRDLAVRTIETEFDGIDDGILEPWDDA
jgi:hypothetical protein